MKKKFKSMKIKKKKPVERISFRCPKTGNLCIVEDPSREDKKKLKEGKLTAFDVVG